MTDQVQSNISDINLADIPYAHNDMIEAKHIAAELLKRHKNDNEVTTLAEKVIEFQKDLNYDLTYYDIVAQPINTTTIFRGEDGVVYKKVNAEIYVAPTVEGPFVSINRQQLIYAMSIMYRTVTKEEEARVK